MTGRTAMTLVAAAIALAAAGCGEDDDRGGGVPDQRPADFAVTFTHVDGSVPPPHHAEWVRRADSDGPDGIRYTPDYPGEGVPTFVEEFELSPAELDRLYSQLREAGLLEAGNEGSEVLPGGDLNTARVTLEGERRSGSGLPGRYSRPVPGSNGKRRPPRPRIEIGAASASPEEAAAIAAALEQFLIETAPAPSPSEQQDPWQRAALHEGLAARQIEPSGWGPAVGR